MMKGMAGKRAARAATWSGEEPHRLIAVAGMQPGKSNEPVGIASDGGSEVIEGLGVDGRGLSVGHDDGLGDASRVEERNELFRGVKPAEFRDFIDVSMRVDDE
jgi:hypothetical protein